VKILLSLRAWKRRRVSLGEPEVQTLAKQALHIIIVVIVVVIVVVVVIIIIRVAALSAFFLGN
jgi:uncharacterized Tic20 family protein